MVRVSELKKEFLGSRPPYKVLVFDKEGNLVEEKSFSNVDDVILFAKEFFNGSFRGVKLSLEGESSVKITLKRRSIGKLEIVYTRIYQKSLLDFIG